MSQYQAFRRQPVPGQFAQQLKTMTIPAPTRGIVVSENEAFMRPGAAIVQDNWVPTLRGVKLRGGTIRWCDLHHLDVPVWAISTAYVTGNIRRDSVDNSLWKATADHTSPGAGTFAAARAATPGQWIASTGLPLTDPARLPVISAFEYVSGNAQRMFAGQATKLWDVTNTVPVVIKTGQTSGNYVASQLANLAGYWMLVCNETGDSVLRFDGTTWTTLTTELTGGPVPGTAKGLSYVCKYRNRYFFIETKSMNMWYLPIDSHQGALTKIPMSGAAQKGGYLVALADWSIDAGDGIDNKLVAITSEGELLVFTGSNPADPNNWRQEGRYHIAPPMGMNAHTQVGGDLLVLTVDGIVPVSQAITKSSGQLDLSMVTLSIRQLWREEAVAKRAHPWTIREWEEYGGIFITTPGGAPGKRYCLAMNNATGAFCRLPGVDAMCWVRMRGDMFFGNQAGIIMQMERTGYDDGLPYLATLVGGWEMFQAQSNQTVLHQMRAVFTSPPIEPFEPQLSATTDFIVTIPPPPAPGPDPGLADVWDEGLWDTAKWDAPVPSRPAHRNTLWVSIGMTGFAHAPIVQVQVAQQARPQVELVALATTFEQAGVNV